MGAQWGEGGVRAGVRSRNYFPPIPLESTKDLSFDGMLLRVSNGRTNPRDKVGHAGGRENRHPGVAIF
jgi:hypothetical protein